MDQPARFGSPPAAVVGGQPFSSLPVALRRYLEQHQPGVIEAWNQLPTVEDRARLESQIARLETSAPGKGGLAGYLERAGPLLSGVGGLHTKWTNVSPAQLGEKLKVNLPKFEESNEIGLAAMAGVAFVIVAGGIGERLQSGSSPIVKALLPVDLISEISFLESHVQWISAFQRKAREWTKNPRLNLPLAVMTSEDTHNPVMACLSDVVTMDVLSDVTALRQEKVACFANAEGQLAIDPTQGLVVTKPHGHGDVHALLHKSGLAHRWANDGVKFVVFIQDTNALAFRAVPVAVGASIRNDLDVNMVTVPRRPGEAIGACCDVADASTGQVRTLNVEYNLIDAVLEREGKSEKALVLSDGYSPFPGNINILVVKMATYAPALVASEGLVPEFVNTKTKPGSSASVKFKSPVRLESMMQDVPLIMPPQARVGYTEMERFICYSPVKNNLRDALVKLQLTGYPESASSAESDVYACGRKLLAMAGCNIRSSGALSVKRFAGLPFEDGAKIVLSPDFGVTPALVRGRFPFPDHVKISDRSSLVLDGEVVIHSLTLDGALVIRAVPGAKVVVKNLTVTNSGVVFEALSEEELAQPDADPAEIVRGFRKKEIECLTILASEPNQEVVIDRPV